MKTELKKQTLLDIQNLLNQCDIAYLCMLLANTSKDFAFYNQILFALDCCLDRNRWGFEESKEKFEAGMYFLNNNNR